MPLYANIGLLILIYQTLLRIFLNETSVTAKIAICGVAGTLLILMNFIFFRKVKA